MSNRIRRKCTRTMKIMSLAGVNDGNVISGKISFVRRVNPNHAFSILDRSSIYNSSQSSLENSVFNCSTSSSYEPGYLEVSSEHLKSSNCNKVNINKYSRNQYNVFEVLNYKKLCGTHTRSLLII